MGDFRRFERPVPVAAYLGMTPSEHTSDKRRRQGAITEAGSRDGRRVLVKAAHRYAKRPNVGVKLSRRQEGPDPARVPVAWRAQRRLHSRWTYLAGERSKPAGKVAIACARELASFCCEAATLK